MLYYLPTYEEAKAIAERYDNFQFYEKEQTVDGYNIRTFNYRLVGYNDFVNPLGEDSDVKAFELRGLSYVFNEDGSLYKRFLLMNKFFNLNQVESTLYDKIKHLKFKAVHNKEDGSVINFIKLPNGRTLAKSKMQVDNEQATKALEVYNNKPEIKEVVEWALGNDIMPIFEYVSPTNRVVLKYKETDLVLLRLRCLTTGKYLDLNTYPKLNEVRVVETEEYSSWDELNRLAETVSEKEGWVVTLEDNDEVDLVKRKTTWYCDRHHLLTDEVYREDFIIRKTVDNTIDDVIAQVDQDDTEVLDIIDKVVDTTVDYIKRAVKKTEDTLELFNSEFASDKKSFVLGYGKKDKYFSYTLAVVNGKADVLEVVQKDLLDNTNKLERARSFVEKGDF
jgi:T4 RnlA family RNA ligase